MALDHALPGQAIPVAPLGARLRETPTHTLLKTHATELIRVVLQAGDAWPTHSIRGEMTLLCLEGSAELSIDGALCTLGPGELVLLPAGVPHALHARQDTSLLLTLQTPAGTLGSASSTM
ncbi:MAG TPA: cupin domain-containing protein [Ideonella sp.]|nr:cupin domain-containing protein [Ideonella sp.]